MLAEVQSLTIETACPQCHCPIIWCWGTLSRLLCHVSWSSCISPLQATHGQGVELEPSEEMALAAMQIDKQTARQLLNSSLPVPSEVLMGHQKALAQIATKAHQQRLHVSASQLLGPSHSTKFRRCDVASSKSGRKAGDESRHSLPLVLLRSANASSFSILAEGLSNLA